MPFKRAILWTLAAILVACLAAAVTAFIVIKDELGRSTTLAEPVWVEIAPGQDLRAVAAGLSTRGLVGSEKVFLALARWRGTDRAIKYGRHEFRGTLDLDGVLAELARAPRPLLRVTIPEGLTVRQTAGLLEEAGATTAAAYLAVACSEEARRAAGSPSTAACAEGYLFPDTYDLVPAMSPGAVVDLQLRRFREALAPVLGEEPKDEAEMARILTLASIVEKETALGSERPRIAAVFLNRLRLGMPLQTDPTVIYGVVDSGAPWDGNLTRAHLEADTPYNTYRRKGLPPGPICNPGRAAVEAVLHPASTDELYFVARGDGSHEFSRNLADHNRAVRLYQLR